MEVEGTGQIIHDGPLCSSWEIKKTEDSPNISQSPKELLKDECKQQINEGLQDGTINWVKDGNDWEKDIKPKLSLALGNGEVYHEDKAELFFVAHSNDKIRGKLQLIEQHKQRLPIVKRFQNRQRLPLQ